MVWMGIALTLAAAVIAAVATSAQRPDDDLGAVSAHWIAQHRVDAP